MAKDENALLTENKNTTNWTRNRSQIFKIRSWEKIPGRGFEGSEVTKAETMCGGSTGT
jgi:hypothetical protein